MHHLLGLLSLLLVVLGSYLVLGSLRRISDWSQRRNLQLLVLAAPVASLGLGMLALHHFAGRACFIGAPPWDYTLGIALPVVMGLIAVGGSGLGLVRLALMYRLVNSRGAPADPELQEMADHLARQLRAPRPRLRLCPYNRPLALTIGLWQPTLLLSTWMVQHLDRRELETVLAHELGHAARRDCLVVWLATVLRDAFFYLPTSWRAFRQLQHEKELACDDLAVGVTNRPLALASALAKVWEQDSRSPTFGTAQSISGTGHCIEDRIERLLTPPQPTARSPRSRLVASGIGGLAVASVLALQGATATAVLASMGCGPASLIGKLF